MAKTTGGMRRKPAPEPVYWLHKFKHLACGLHFMVTSDFKEWPDKGTTREQRVGEATGVVTCPECGGTKGYLHWREEAPGFIMQAVPGKADLIGMRP